MKNISTWLLSLLVMTAFTKVAAQKQVTDGTVIYDVTIENGANKSSASNTVYVKGNNSRTEMVSPLGSETIIHNAKSAGSVILKEFSGQKLMIKLTKENWDAKNRMFSNVTFTPASETKSIAGYACKKAVAKTSDGKTFDVYYTPDLVMTNKQYDPTFASLPGLAMEYTIESGKLKFTYTVSKISFDQVPLAKFDFPTSGYRVMTYEENQEMKKGN